MQAYLVNGMRVSAHPTKVVSKLDQKNVDRILMAVARPHKQRITINVPKKRETH